MTRKNVRHHDDVKVGDMIFIWRDNSGWIVPAPVANVDRYQVTVLHNNRLKTSSRSRAKRIVPRDEYDSDVVEYDHDGDHEDGPAPDAHHPKNFKTMSNTHAVLDEEHYELNGQLNKCESKVASEIGTDMDRNDRGDPTSSTPPIPTVHKIHTNGNTDENKDSNRSATDDEVHGSPISPLDAGMQSNDKLRDYDNYELGMEPDATTTPFAEYDSRSKGGNADRIQLWAATLDDANETKPPQPNFVKETREVIRETDKFIGSRRELGRNRSENNSCEAGASEPVNDVVQYSYNSIEAEVGSDPSGSVPMTSSHHAPTSVL